MEIPSKLSIISIRRTLCVLLLIVGISIFSTMRLNATTISFDPPTYSSLTPHDPISITSNSGFEVFPGTGTAEDPYLIEDYNITTTDDYGIYVYATTKHFIVRNCLVDADYGIYINNVTDDTVTIFNNTCSNNGWIGIWLHDSPSSIVANNTCNNNGDYGISLSSSGSSTVINNTCKNNYFGIYLHDSEYSTVSNNTCSNNSNRGISLEDSEYSKVVNNTCGNNKYMGILLSYSRSSTAKNNTCNNNDWGGIYVSFSGSSTIFNNTCISNNRRGISLSSSGSSTVINNKCNNNNYGISLEDSDSCVVTYNLLQENRYYGVCLNEIYGFIYYYSDNNLIHHNTFVDNYPGGTSQAFDECTNNYWYDTETQEGNYWSDWSGKGNYSIDGSSSSIDFYPLKEPVEYSTDETQIFFTFTLLIVIVPLIFIKKFSRKRR